MYTQRVEKLFYLIVPDIRSLKRPKTMTCGDAPERRLAADAHCEEALLDRQPIHLILKSTYYNMRKRKMQPKGAGNMQRNGNAIEIPAYVRRTLERLESAGHQAYCVGGCVRDSLLGRLPGDWDVTTSALPEETLAVFGTQAIPTGLKHGTVTVCWDEGKVETTTFRRDGAYIDHRHPEQVEFTASLAADLARRDFTVNAMALDLRGGLYDPFGGGADLENRTLRCVGDPALRFTEDALRILRCLRFAAVLGFDIAPETGTAMAQCRMLLREIASERVREELTKLLCGKNAAAVLRRSPETVGAVLPEILPMVGFDQHNHHHCYDVWEHTLHALDAVPPLPVLRWAMLFHDMGKPECFALDDRGVGHFMGHGVVSRRIADGIMERLRFDHESRERIGELVEWHDHRVETERGVRRALNRFGEENFRALLAVQRADNMGQAEKYRCRQRDIDRVEAMLDRELEQGSCFSLKQLAVDGHDLMKLGYSGPAVGRGLHALLERVMDGSLPNEREALLTAAQTPEN